MSKKEQGLLTPKALNGLAPGQTVSELAPRGSGVLQAKMLTAGSIAFYFRYTKPDGTRDRLRLPAGISLVEARRRARDLSIQYQSGSGNVREENDIEERERTLEEQSARKRADDELAKQRATLGALLVAYADELKTLGRSSAGSVAAAFRRHVEQPWPGLWSKSAAEISGDELVAVVSRVVQAGHLREAGKLRSYIQAAYAAARQARFNPLRSVALRDLQIRVNPASDLSMIGSGIGTRDRVLSPEELRAYWRRIVAWSGCDGAILRFHLLTGAQRIDQLARVKKSDLDADAPAILIRDGKGRRPVPRNHFVPLIPSAVVALEDIESRLGPYLIGFTGGKSGITHHTFNERVSMVAEAMIEGGELPSGRFTSGDLRRTVETRLAASKVSSDVRAQVQSHGISGVQARHYDRYDYFDEKLDALSRLHDYLEER